MASSFFSAKSHLHGYSKYIHIKVPTTKSLTAIEYAICISTNNYK